MAFNQPTLHGDLKPEVWEQSQAAAGSKPGADPAMTAQIQQLPSYPLLVQEITHKGTPANLESAWKRVVAEAAQKGISIPDDKTLDMRSANLRDKTWTEKHPVLSGVLITAGFAGGGVAAGALAGGAATGAGVAGATGAASTAAPTIAGTTAGTAAATGGTALSTALPYIKMGADVAGNYLQGKSQDELNQAKLQQGQQQINNQANQFGATFARQNPGTQMSNSVRGDILANVQPAKLSGSGRDLKLSGGLSPALFSDNTRQLGALTSRQALLAAMGQEDSDGKIGGVTNPYHIPLNASLPLGRR